MDPLKKVFSHGLSVFGGKDPPTPTFDGKWPICGPNGATIGRSAGNSFPKRSRFGISHKPNGGVVIVNPLDITDNNNEKRTY
jgi:hypothetical protein